VVAIVDGDLFNQGGNALADVTFAIDTDMQSLAIAQDTNKTFSPSPANNNGFQIEYIGVEANQDGTSSFSYPIDVWGLIQDNVGTAETFIGLKLSDLPSGAIISVVHNGTYEEITANAQGEYDLSEHASLLDTATNAGTDQIYLVTDTALPVGFVPTMTLEVSDGELSTAKTILGGSESSIHSGGTGSDYISGGAGNDTLDGGIGNDILIGGEGDDILFGGAGADTFVWQAGDIGNDVIRDFNIGEGDQIDLRDLLQGEEAENAPDITQYLRVDTTTSTLLISSTGTLNADGSNADASIKLENNGTPVNLNPGNLSQSDLVNSLIAGADPMIKTDHI
jgi:Ca2+-binding RTX toxin-like protein